MAGYIMNLNDDTSLHYCITNGVYSTRMSPPTGYWRLHHEATCADYSSMREGDNIYFFIDRKIYGIGRLVNILGDCKFNNYPGATLPINTSYNAINSKLLLDIGPDSINNRWLCVFEPSPYFFKDGIDMDDVLSSNPSKFKMLRAFWKLSFVKVDDDENKALKDVILKRNEHVIFNPNALRFPFNSTLHSLIQSKLPTDIYNLNVQDILKSCTNNTYLKHEMAIEAGTLFQLSNNYPQTVNTLGKWDYLSHQVVASPFKPIDYVDKMDIFGYKYIPGFDTISKYLVIEIKRDSAKVEDLEQLMKYVDWVNQEYAFGDYSMINAFLIAYDFDNKVITQNKIIPERNYIIGRRPAQSKTWTNLKLVKYVYNDTNKTIEYTLL